MGVKRNPLHEKAADPQGPAALYLRDVLELVADAEAPLVLAIGAVEGDPGVAEVQGDVMSEHLAHGRVDLMTRGVAHIGGPGAEATAKRAVQGDAVGLVRTDGQGDVGEGGDVLEAIAQGDGVGTVTKVAAKGGQAIHEDVGLADVSGGGNPPAIEMPRDAGGALLNIAQLDVIREKARWGGSRHRGGRQGREGRGGAEGEETGVGEVLHVWGIGKQIRQKMSPKVPPSEFQQVPTPPT